MTSQQHKHQKVQNNKYSFDHVQRPPGANPQDLARPGEVSEQEVETSVSTRARQKPAMSDKRPVEAENAWRSETGSQCGEGMAGEGAVCNPRRSEPI